jgi:hypothetical protein
LRQALRFANNEAAKMLVDHGADIIYKGLHHKYSPLFFAIKMDNAQVIEHFCDLDVDLQTLNPEG